MMQYIWPEPVWWGQLPVGPVYARNVPLAPMTTMKVGGAAEVWAEFAGWAALQTWLGEVTGAIPLTILGKGSNVVIEDGGVPGVVTRLADGFDAVRVEGTRVYAEAGAACGTVARAAREAGLAGVAFFGGIPGAIGGALKMNAGAYGHETYDAVVRLWLLDGEGRERVVAKDSVQPGYRHTSLPPGWVFKAAEWQLAVGDKEAIRQEMRRINHARSSTQPLHLPSSGSWFRNHTPDEVQAAALRAAGVDHAAAGVKVHAWQVVQAAGCRGLRVGGAQVSEQHANFFVNVGLGEGHSATAADVHALDAAVLAQVQQRLGIGLVREVRFMGKIFPLGTA
jgi:UDP-N-acetylmuramate dehydrogenase